MKKNDTGPANELIAAIEGMALGTAGRKISARINKHFNEAVHVGAAMGTTIDGINAGDPANLWYLTAVVFATHLAHLRDIAELDPGIQTRIPDPTTRLREIFDDILRDRVEPPSE